VLERFYRLPAPLIDAFYAGEARWATNYASWSGKPPVPIGRRLSCLSEAPLLAERPPAHE